MGANLILSLVRWVFGNRIVSILLIAALVIGLIVWAVKGLSEKK